MSPYRSIKVVATLLATLLLQTGCTRMQLVENPEGAALADVIDVGARVRVLDASGVSTDFEVTAIDADRLVGTTSEGETVRFAFGDVREVRERTRAPGLTATLIGLGVGVFVRSALEDVYFLPQ